MTRKIIGKYKRGSKIMAGEWVMKYFPTLPDIVLVKMSKQSVTISVK